MSKKNTIYERLATVSKRIADKATTEKTNGGRSLNAIHKSKNLNSTEKHLLLILANKMNFTRSFENQYQGVSLNEIADDMSASKMTVIRIINGYESRGKKINGLVAKGYVIKIESSFEQQQKWDPNKYCLTSLIFEEHMHAIIDDELRKEEKYGNKGSSNTVRLGVVTPCDSGSNTVRLGVVTPCDTIIPILPDLPNSNAAVHSAAAQNETPKRCRSAQKISRKTWEDKNHEEKINTLENLALDAHITAVKKKRARPFPGDDIPDILKPIIVGYGLEKLKEFLDGVRDLGCDVRTIAKKMDESAKEMTKSVCEVFKPALSKNNIADDVANVKLELDEFSDVVLSQIMTSDKNANKLGKNNELKEIQVENFPVRLKDFYENLDKRAQSRVKKEIIAIGLDKFIKMRAPAILKCSYDDLFENNALKNDLFGLY